jgi:putative DNA primase/helicase
LPRLVWAAAKNHASDDGSMPRIFVRAKSNIGPSGGGFGYDIDAAPLYECPNIIATRIVWLDPLERTLKRAKESSKVKSIKIGNIWWWARD